MGLETVTHISDLVITNPVGATDMVQYGDDHIRNIKVALKTDLPNITGPITATQAELNVLDGYTGNTNDLNVIAGGAAAGVTSTKFQYLATPTGALYYSGGTDVPVTDGGTGASTAANARTNLGIGTLGTLNSLVETSIDWSGCAAIGFGTFYSNYSLSVTTVAANMAAQGNDPTFLVYVPESATTMTYGFYCNANTTGGTISIRLNHATPGNGTAISFASTSTLAWRSSGTITVSALSGVTSFNLQSYCSTSSDTVNVFALWYYFT